MGFLLYLSSIVLQVILVPVGVIFGLVKSFVDTHIGNGFVKANYKFRKMALSTDMYGNVYCEELFNATLITKDSVNKFGEYGITISRVLAVNFRAGTLTKVGKVVCWVLIKFKDTEF